MDKLPLEFHPDARSEAIAAFDWYGERSPSAAQAFYEELQNAGNAIQHTPERWANYSFGTRRYLMKRNFGSCARAAQAWVLDESLGIGMKSKPGVRDHSEFRRANPSH